MVALILANGNQPSLDLLKREARRAGLFVVTDGAANTLTPNHPRPGVVLGDFDSITSDVLGALGPAQVVPAADQDHSDLEKAITYALDRGATSIVIAGALGGRVDHELVAFALMARYAQRAAMEMVHDGLRAWWVDRPLTFDAVPGDGVSLIAFQTVGNVSVAGTEWPLHAVTLEPGSHGVSNRATGTRVQVRADPPGLLAILLEPCRP